MNQASWETLSLKDLGEQIGSGRLDPRELVDYFLNKIEREREKERIFIEIYSEEARRFAREAYERARNHQRLSLYDGIPLAWKDNFDIADRKSVV